MAATVAVIAVAACATPFLVPFTAALAACAVVETMALVVLPSCDMALLASTPICSSGVVTYELKNFAGGAAVASASSAGAGADSSSALGIFLELNRRLDPKSSGRNVGSAVAEIATMLDL